jgi:predicted nicotinamide N-methyase
MLAFWIELKRRLKTAGWALLTAGGALLLAVAYLFTKRAKNRVRATTLDPMLEQAAQRTAAANARASIEVHIARTKEEAVRSELAAIDKDADGDSRRQRLIELAARVEGAS